MGNELVSPNLMPDQTMTGERLGKLFTQRTVWLIPNKKVTFSPFLLSNMFYLLLVLLTFTTDSKKKLQPSFTRVYNGNLCTRWD